MCDSTIKKHHKPNSSKFPYVRLTVLVLFLGIFLKSKLAAHDENALLSDWSSPPPLPILAAVKAISGALRTVADKLTPPPVQMLEIGMVMQTTVLAHIMCDQKIPDFLAKDNRSKSITEITEFTQTNDAEHVERLMFALASRGMTKLSVDSTKENPKFVNTALSATCRLDHPNYVGGYVALMGHDLFPVWNYIPSLFGPSSKNKDIVWDLAYPSHPISKGGLWSLYKAEPYREKRFTLAMEAKEGMGGWAMAMDGPFKKFNRFLDLGGSKGHFLYKLLHLHPESTGVLFDRPEVSQIAELAWKSGEFEQSEDMVLTNRVMFQGGDLFSSKTIPKVQGEGDAFFMRNVLHDWNDAEVNAILENVRKAMGETKATLLIGENSMPDRDSVGAPLLYAVDFQMMAISDGSAKERTPTQWENVLEKNGFKVMNFHKTRTLLHWIEAVPI